jgi:bis(5'-nucleosidyl)-tetraphosphatase
MHKPLKKKSCGILCFRDKPDRAFLLMRHADRLDLPKGHIEPGETEIQCALREFEEETGLSRAHLTLDPDFRFETSYMTRVERDHYKPVEKSVVIFLAEITSDIQPVIVSEHVGYVWQPWKPPHTIQAGTIDPLLRAVETFWKQGEIHGD